MTEKERAYQIKRWRENCATLEKMIAGNYPPALRAHLLIRVFLMRLIDITECTEFVGEQLAGTIAAGIAHKLGNCLICKKSKATQIESHLCDKCGAEVDQYTAELDSQSQEHCE
jgi:hypothetical protein